MNIGAIGDVKYSILPESLFQQINGAGWILADGRDITGSELHQRAGIVNIPDTRACFLRGMNCNRNDTHKDTDGNRPAGGFQVDTTRQPRTRQFTGITSVNGNHNHSLSTVGIWRRSFEGEDSGPRTAHEQAGHTSVAGNHQHNIVINGGGDYETRPKNIAFYIYIKINN